MRYPFTIREGRKCNLCGQVFTAEIKHLNRWKMVAPKDFIDSLLQHRQEHLDKGEQWEDWEVLWGDQVPKGK